MSKVKVIGVSLPQDLLGVVELLCERTETPLSSFVRAALLLMLQTIDFKFDDGKTLEASCNKVKDLAAKAYATKFFDSLTQPLPAHQLTADEKVDLAELDAILKDGGNTDMTKNV